MNGYENAFFSGLTSLELSKIIYNFFHIKEQHFNKILNIGGNKISKFFTIKISKIFKKLLLKNHHILK